MQPIRIHPDIPVKHYSLSALSKESGIRKKILSSWIENGWLVGDKISDDTELYTARQLNEAKILANRTFMRAQKVQFTPEEKGTMTILEFNLQQYINSLDKKKNKGKS